MDRKALVCRCFFEDANATQREIAKTLDVSLGTANSIVKECVDEGLIRLNSNSAGYELLEAGMEVLKQYKVDGALIIAAGFGSRFVPLTFETPKGLLEVFGERMIERQIKQLHEVGIKNITIVVGYLKEKFEYLIDKYGVELLYNQEYSCKNTLTTIYKAKKVLEGKNMYVLSSDNWMRENMFHHYECGAWYSAVKKEGKTSEWCLITNKKGLITDVKVGGEDSFVMYGPVFFSKEFSKSFLPVLETYYNIPGTEQFYWENVYMEMINGMAEKRLGHAMLKDKPASMYINRQPDTQVYEFENLEELRLFDTKYQNHSDNKAMELVAEVFGIKESEISEIRCLKSGMTNKSFLFKVNDKHYICRIPGPGTSVLINRKQEYAVYECVKSLNITEKVIYFDAETGYKIAEYYEGARNSDARDWEEVEKCMDLLHILHDAQLKVDHEFQMRERIGFYEALCEKNSAILFEDYADVRRCMNELMDRLDRLDRPKVLSHIDSVADNFLFLPDGSLRLIDWEYAGMSDPLIDVAMCAIYSFYDEDETEKLIQIYLGRKPEQLEKEVIYAYMALGGFLWSLWAVYKESLGEEFGEYTLIMYRYAKKYYRKIVQ